MFNGVKVWEVMQRLLMGSKRILNEALSQILKLEVARGAQSSQKQGCKWHGLEPPREHCHHPPSTAELDDLYNCNVGMSAIIEETANRNMPRTERKLAGIRDTRNNAQKVSASSS